MKKFLVLVLAFAFASVAHAQTATKLMGVGFAAEQAKVLAERSSTTEGLKVTNSSGTPVAGITPASGNAVIGGTLSVTGATTLTGATTITGAQTLTGQTNHAADAVFASGKGVQEAVAIITPSTNMTPAAASNLSAKVNRLISTSPTLAAVHVPAATANVGKDFVIVNEGANPVLVFPSGASDTLNAGAAGTPVSVAAGKIADCLGVAAGKYQCGAR